MPRLSSQRYAGSQFATLLTTPLPVPRRHPPYRSNLNQYIGHVEKCQLETCPEYDKGHFIGFESHGYSPVCAWEHLKVAFFISRTVDAAAVPLVSTRHRMARPSTQSSAAAQARQHAGRAAHPPRVHLCPPDRCRKTVPPARPEAAGTAAPLAGPRAPCYHAIRNCQLS